MIVTERRENICYEHDLMFDVSSNDAIFGFGSSRTRHIAIPMGIISQYS